jgi:hypothetical protein
VITHFKEFGNVDAFFEFDEWLFEIEGGFCYNEEKIAKLEDQIKRARQWVEEQKKQTTNKEKP